MHWLVGWRAFDKESIVTALHLATIDDQRWLGRVILILGCAWITSRVSVLSTGARTVRRSHTSSIVIEYTYILLHVFIRL